MDSFKDFMDDIHKAPNQPLQASEMTLSSIQTSLAAGISGILFPISATDNDKQKFTEEVAGLIQNDAFLKQFSDKVGTPSEADSEEEFVTRGSDVLKKMLYEKFGLK